MRDFRAMLDALDAKRRDMLFSNVTTPDMRIRCPDCGNLNPGESGACNYCGSKLIPRS